MLMFTISTKKLLWTAALIGLAVQVQAQPIPRAESPQIHKQFPIIHDYWLSLPDGYDDDPTKQWPMIIFLHGGGESNRDGVTPPDKVRESGLAWGVDHGIKKPFVIISPQALDRWDPPTLNRLVQEALKDYRVDPERVYLTGGSMGGYGTWEMATAFPHLFAAIAPICGGEDTRYLKNIAHMPVWAFHGAKDDIVSVEGTRNIVKTLRQWNPDVRYTEIPEGNHYIAMPIYEGQELYDWFLSHTRFRHKVIAPLDTKVLEKYVGKYVCDEVYNTVEVTLKDGKLMVGPIELLPLAENRFAMDLHNPMYVDCLVNPDNGRMELFLKNGNAPMGFYWREQ